MLVLSRKKSETVSMRLTPEILKRLLDADTTCEITVGVVEIRGDKVRLGFVAPNEVPVHRSEVWLRLDTTREEQGQWD